MENLFHSNFRPVLHLDDENTIVEQCQCMLENVSDQYVVRVFVDWYAIAYTHFSERVDMYSDATRLICHLYSCVYSK